MKTFMEWLIKESLGYEYFVPKDSLEKQVFDFYTWFLIHNYMAKVNIQDDETSLDLQWIANESFKKIVDYLYPRIQYAILYGLVDEMANFFDRTEFGRNNLNIRTLIPYSNKINIGHLEKLVANIPSNKKFDFNKLIKFIENSLGLSDRQYVEFAIEVYNDKNNKINWDGMYGKEKWAKIGQGYLRLLDFPKDLVNKAIIIDNMLSLHHNSGSALNKVNWKGWEDEFADFVLKDFLDTKFKEKPHVVASMSSIPKNILGYFSKLLNIDLVQNVSDFSKLPGDSITKKLLSAIKIGNLSLIKNIFSKYHYNPYDPDQIEYSYDYLLSQAAEFGQFHIVKYMVEELNIVSYKQAIKQATKFGHFEIVKYLKNIDPKKFINNKKKS